LLCQFCLDSLLVASTFQLRQMCLDFFDVRTTFFQLFLNNQFADMTFLMLLLFFHVVLLLVSHSFLLLEKSWSFLSCKWFFSRTLAFESFVLFASSFHTWSLLGDALLFARRWLFSKAGTAFDFVSGAILHSWKVYKK